MMKFPILLLSAILSVRAIDVRVGFDNLFSPPGFYSVRIDLDFPPGEWVPSSFNFTLFVDVEAPSPTKWTYSIDGVSIASGTDDFCDPTPMTPGGIGIQLLQYGLGLSDKECPLKQYTKVQNLPWTWAEVQSVDLDDIFDAAAKSLDSDVSTDEVDDPSSEPASGGMKRRRRDSSPLSVKLDIINNFIDATLILSAEV